MKRHGWLLGAALLCVPASGGQAHAACFEDVGCTDDQNMSSSQLRRLSCENLWMVRNQIYDDNGYCFATSRGRRTFNNDDCYVSDQARVSLNSYERANVGKIVAIETEKGCR